MWCDKCGAPCAPIFDLCHEHRQKHRQLVRERKIRLYYEAKRKGMDKPTLLKMGREIWGSSAN